MKKLNFAVLLGLLWFIPNVSSFGQGRSTISVNSHWKFQKGNFNPSNIHFESEKWPIIHLPHTWNDKDVLPDGERGYYRGEAWYFKELNISADQDLSNYFIHFEGANQETTLYINGHLVGMHAGGYSAFRFDITAYVKEGKNQIAVKVDNTHNPDIPPLSADFTFFGGIYRDVWLIETAKVHFDMENYGSDGIFIHTPNVSSESAEIKILGAIQAALGQLESNKITLSFKIKHPQKGIIYQNETDLELQSSKKEISWETIHLNTPDLWSPESPTLYQLEATIYQKEVVLDQLNIPFGLRFFHFDPEKGFFLNGKQTKLMGANRHQDYIGQGNALSDELHWSDMKAIKDMGGNFVRLAHYPQDPAILRAADELGLMVWEETPLVNEVTKSKKHDLNSEIMLKEMIRQHYNHPSVIIWGYMNEIYWAHRFIDPEIVDAQTTHSVELAEKLEKIAREEDPYRYTAMALHNYPLYESSEIANIPQIVSWNLYHGWYYDEFEDFGKFMDEQHEKYPDRIHFISEYGAGSDTRLHSLKPEKFDFTIEGHKRFLESFLKQIYTRQYISGATVWNLIDFSSERRIDSNPHLNNKGIMTSERVPKDVYYLFQAYLSNNPILKIAETNWKNRSALSEDGNTAILPIQVYSNLNEVELYHQGKSLGTLKPKDNQATWEVEFKKGINSFTAKNKAGEEILDYIEIDFLPVPIDLSKTNLDRLFINLGSNHSFFDAKGKVTYIQSKPYEKNSWGHIGGAPLYIANKIGTKEDILTTDDFVPLYQTMQEGIDGFKADLPDGDYIIELWMVEPFPKSRKFVDGVESPEHPGGQRIFDIVINDKVIFKNLDLLKEYGYNYPFKEKVKVQLKDGKGLEISFVSKKGKPILSALSIQKQ